MFNSSFLQKIYDIQATQGWDETSMLELFVEFLTNRGQGDEFVKFLADVAEEEIQIDELSKEEAERLDE